jgi:pyruvate dehydrogenase (quinone)
MPRNLQGIDYMQATDPDLLFRDVSLYTETISSGHRRRLCWPRRGHLTLPQDVVNARAEGSVSSLATLKPRPETIASEADYRDRTSHRPSRQHCDHVRCRMSWRSRRIARALRSPEGAIHSVKGKDIMPYDDPRWMGGVGMIGAKADYKAIMDCDLLLMLGTDYPYAKFLPRKSAVIQVDDRARVLGRRAPTALGVVGSVRPTVKSLLTLVKPKSDRKFFDLVTAHRKARTRCWTSSPTPRAARIVFIRRLWRVQ